MFPVRLNSCESSFRGGTLNDENVIIKYTTLLTWIWLIFGAIQLRYPNFPSPFMQLPAKKTELPLTPGPSPQGEGGFKQLLTGAARL